MSLIQEALRRQQEDMDDSAGVAPKSQPTTPPPSPQEAPRIARKVQISSQAVNDDSEPPPVQIPTQMESGATPDADDDVDAVSDAGVTSPAAAGEAAKPGLKVILLIIGVILCLAFGVWAITFAIQTWSKSEPAPGTENSANANPAETNQPVEAGTAPETAVVDVPEVIEPGTVPSPVIDSPAAPEAVPAPVAAETVVWPLLTIDGLVGKGAQGAAMINAQIVGVNESIEGVKVVDIQKQGVTLEFEGEKKFVKVGGTTTE